MLPENESKLVISRQLGSRSAADPPVTACLAPPAPPLSRTCAGRAGGR